MTLEAVMVCVDNSEWMRNGDYAPTRLDVQREAANYVSNLKQQANRENAIGVLTMAGKRIDVLSTPSSDLGQVMTAINAVRVGGVCNFASALKTAQLVLKNRQNKNQRQRIVMFVGSPIDATAKELTKLGKNLRKNNVAVDVVNFGMENTENENTEKLEAFVGAVNSSENSHLVVVPPGPHNFVDMIVSTLFEDAGPVSGSGGMDMGGGDMDPELELAIRMSLEEEQARQERERSEKGEPMSIPEPVQEDQQEEKDEDMDDEMAQALAMSLEQGDEDVDMGADEDALQDPAFLEDLLSDLNVDKDDVDMQKLLDSLANEKKDKKDKK